MYPITELNMIHPTLSQSSFPILILVHHQSHTEIIFKILIILLTLYDSHLLSRRSGA